MATTEPAHSGKELVEKYLSAYKALDTPGMEACMDPEFKFNDPAFPNLDAKHSRAMFRMFISNRDKNKIQVTYENLQKGTNDLTYTADYTTTYIFNGRDVSHTIHATFTISPQSNLLLTQTDSFSFYHWAQQALGLPGLLLGWSGFMQSKVQQTAGENLKKFVSKSEAKSTPATTN